MSVLFITYWTDAQTQESGVVIDIDGNTYKTAIVSNYIWMSENLRVTAYKNGTKIPLITNDSIWSATNSGAYCWYNNNPNNSSTYGALYNWFTVNTGNLCPDGWQVPSDEDWKYLEGSLDTKYKVDDSIWNGTMLRGFDAGYMLKGKFGWNSNGNGSDLYGLNALPAGECSSNRHYFRHIGNNGFWWSSTSFDSTKAWYRCLVFFDNKIIRNTHPKAMGFSVRCIKKL